MFPRWMPRARRVMEEKLEEVDGSRDYRRMMEAVEVAPTNSKKRYVIGIRGGIGEQVGKTKSLLASKSPY